MKAATLTLEQATAWLRKNKDFIHHPAVEQKLKVDHGTYYRAVNDLLTTQGRRIKLPRRCLPDLLLLIQEICDTTGL